MESVQNDSQLELQCFETPKFFDTINTTVEQRQHRNKLSLHYFDVFVSLDYRPVGPPADPGLATPASKWRKENRNF
jgi:hypothetical protein